MSTKETNSKSDKTVQATSATKDSSIEVNDQDQPISEVKIKFINHSNDMNNSEVVIFSKNMSASFDEVTVAWRVIQNCGRGWNHPFVFPMGFDVGAMDSYGNYSNIQMAQWGQSWEVITSVSGDVLKLSDAPSTNPAEVEIKNHLAMGAMNALIYKDGKVFALKSNLAPGEKAVFEFKPTLWVGVVSQVEEGGIMNSAILSDINTEFTLEGIRSADLIMTGGGVGPQATPFKFELVPTS